MLTVLRGMLVLNNSNKIFRFIWEKVKSFTIDDYQTVEEKHDGNMIQIVKETGQK